jgi:alanyl-tRNA synthetase
METAEIRRRWLQFFEDRGHAVVPSASLVSDDPSLLFVVAGMVPFIPYLTAQQTAPWPRATSVQKCVRTLDIEEVGKTTRHATFFQMNGNFSFGDYFKEEAIGYAWHLVTGSQDEGKLGFDPETIWVTVFQDDDEAYDIWRRVAGVPAERIQRRGWLDNYWSTGQPGPAGPCSEIYVDRGPEHGRDGGPIADEDRYLEIWNLVFMQDERGGGPAKEGFPILGPLPRKNIDTGMGLERVAYLLQGVDNLYEIDEVYPVLERAADLAGKKYSGRPGDLADEGANTVDDVRLRIVADHVRSALMLITDGVTPSNEARGYVVRRLIRRAVRSMRLLGVDEPVLPELLPISRDRMSASYPEVASEFSRVSQVAYAEEEAFRRTLTAGTTILDVAVQTTKRSGTQQLSGDQAFQLHDTYGFPIDLTLEMAAEQGVGVDEEGFRRLMTEQRERAKADSRAKKTGAGGSTAYRGIADGLGRPVAFTGYDEVVSEGQVAGLLVDGEPVHSASAGDDVELVLDRTPFYAEGGGQLADAGRVELGDGTIVQVHDVQRPFAGLVVHRATVLSGQVDVGAQVQSLVDIDRRKAISRAHTATHMVHKAIRDALGDTATQAGSENAPGRFRFDFQATSAVPPSVLADVEAEVNAMLAEDLSVHAEVMTQAQAREIGAMALFGEKYGDEVRVVSIGDWARELCGGTHAQRSGQLGLVKLLGESSIGAGVRRVEALVGSDAHEFLAREHALVGQLTEALKVRPEELPERVASIVNRLRDAEREIEAFRTQQVLSDAGALVDQAHDVFGVRVVTRNAGEGIGADDLRTLALDVRGRLGDDGPSVVALAGVSKDRPAVVVATNAEARRWGVTANALVRLAAGVMGGGGGGKDDIAQGGGTDVTKVDEALAQLEHAIGEAVTRGS